LKLESCDVRHERILGIDFFNGSVDDAVRAGMAPGTCVVISAAPALVKLNYDEEYRRTLRAADLVLADSGLLALLSRVAAGAKLSVISGMDYLRELVRDRSFRDAETFWIVRSEVAKQRAIDFLRDQGITATVDRFYVSSAERDPSENHAILLAIEERKSRHVVIAIMRGAEVLGVYLRDYLLHRPSVHCVGAAVGFLSGDEKLIPRWTERTHLGWMARLFAQPAMFLPRIGMAITLALMVFRYRSDLPKLRTRWTEL
jgi:UDP-N-acetyl-D-mannosaminuronic acid transferase (WecB/TagA/CpsF family)